jgi:hypothetical protein
MLEERTPDKLEDGRGGGGRDGELSVFCIVMEAAKGVPHRLPWQRLLFCVLLPIPDAGAIQCKKRLSFFSSPAWMSLTKPTLAGNIVKKLFPARVGLVSDIPAGEGKNNYLFYSV